MENGIGQSGCVRVCSNMEKKNDYINTLENILLGISDQMKSVKYFTVHQPLARMC